VGGLVEQDSPLEARQGVLLSRKRSVQGHDQHVALVPAVDQRLEHQVIPHRHVMASDVRPGQGIERPWARVVHDRHGVALVEPLGVGLTAHPGAASFQQ
jgi:hypothetical protein